LVQEISVATIYQRGDTWRAQVRLRGQQHGNTFDTEAEARAWAEAIERQIKAGKAATAARAAAAIPGTVADLFDRYAREVSPTKGGERWEIIRLRKLATEFQMTPAELDGAAMAEWRDARLRQVSAYTVKREMTLISAVLTKAIKEWRLPIAANPCHQIEWPRQPAERKRRVSPAERAAILEKLGWDGTSAPSNIERWVAWGWCLAMETMMRQGEILRLTWQHVHLDRRFAHLPKTKNGEARDVPLSSRAVALFDLLKPGVPNQRVVPVNGGTFGNYFRLARKAAGVEDMHFHDSRREALTNASKKLANVAELARASGHRSLRSLMIYYQPDASELAEKLG
jgi:integrase